MNSNTFIGALVIAFILGFGYFFYRGTAAPPIAQTATSTAATSTSPSSSSRITTDTNPGSTSIVRVIGTPSVDTAPAANIATSSALLSGIVRPNNAETTYWFEYSADPNFSNILGTVTTSQRVRETLSNVFVSIKANGLIPDTQYYYRAAASNSAGTAHGGVVPFKTSF